MKKVLTFVSMSLLLLASCSQDTELTSGQTQLPDDNGKNVDTRTMTVGFANTLLEDAALDFTDVEVFAYKTGGFNVDSLLVRKTLPLQNNKLQLELPLDETVQTFLAANHAAVTLDDSLATVTVWQDKACSRKVWLSNTVKFSSNYSGMGTLTMSPAYGEAVIAPTETPETIAAVADSIVFTLRNVPTSWQVTKAESGSEDITFTWKDFTTQPTLRAFAGTKASNLAYSIYKGGKEIRRTPADIDTGLLFHLCKRSTISFPVVDEEYAPEVTEETRAAAPRDAAGKSPKVSITVTDL